MAHDIAGLIAWAKREEWRDALGELLDRHSAQACAAAGIEMEDIAAILGGEVGKLFLVLPSNSRSPATDVLAITTPLPRSGTAPSGRNRDCAEAHDRLIGAAAESTHPPTGLV